MLVLLSPSKSQDFSDSWRASTAKPFTLPVLLDQSLLLIESLRKLSNEQVAKLMGVSPKLAALNVERYARFQIPFTPDNAKPALLAFTGDVYKGLRLSGYDRDDFSFAQQHLRILSGLYGLLRPLDLIQPYRLEMGVRLRTQRGEDLYQFWGPRITQQINDICKREGHETVVNLASNEYFSALNAEQIAGPVITPVFHQIKKGRPTMVAILAKRARGLMADFIVKERVASPPQLKRFNASGYAFFPRQSSPTQWMFARQPA